MDLGTYLDTKGISKREFAERIGVTPEAVRLYTRRDRIPRPEIMRAIIEETKGVVSAYDFYTPSPQDAGQAAE